MTFRSQLICPQHCCFEDLHSSYPWLRTFGFLAASTGIALRSMEFSVAQNPNALGTFAGCELFLHLASRRLSSASTNIGMLKSRGSEGRCKPALHSIGAAPADEHAVAVLGAFLSLLAMAPHLSRFRSNHWFTASALLVANAGFWSHARGSFHYAHRILFDIQTLDEHQRLPRDAASTLPRCNSGRLLSKLSCHKHHTSSNTSRAPKRSKTS
jgi:hypothetical protein